jgi:fibro-slime domain-containing protein
MGPQPRPAVGPWRGALAVALCAACGSAGGDPDAGDGGAADARRGPDGGGLGDDCRRLPVTLRDFSRSHPDFEPDSDSDVAYPGLVRPELGGDGKPVYAHPGATPHTAGPDEFAQWYRDVPGVNLTFEDTLPLHEVAPGRLAFASDAFFPLDGLGFGNEGLPHNFHFTTEIHTTFVYRGGEVFTFTGDDDLWLFINERLAIDLGGLHPSLSATVDLDARAAALGIAPGNTYRMDIFHAERHTDASNFHIETTIDCFVVP